MLPSARKGKLVFLHALYRSTESETLIDERLAKAKIELEYAPKFDRIIINDDLQRAEQEICQLVTAFLDQS